MLAALAAIPAERVSEITLRLAPSCRVVASAFPIFGIWQANQPRYQGEPTPASRSSSFARVESESGGDRLLVRRDAAGIAVERLAAGEHAWLLAIAEGATLGASIDAGRRADPVFDFARALHAHIGAATVVAVAADD